jgi:SAM-dependent methyltransferase
LEIGAAYGVTVLPALAAGAAVIANDVDPKHLEILRERAGPLAGKLSLFPGKFPNEVHLPDSSVAAILVARVLHFFDGATIEESARTIFRWLVPDGKVFITAETPY